MKKRNLGLLFLITVLFLAGCQATQPVKQKGITVISSLDFYGEIAKAVLGNHGHVQSIITNPAIDPHDFEPTTQTAKDVAKGQIILSNGLGYDSWMQKLVEANNQKGVTDLRVGEDIMKKQDGDNEHLWYNKKNGAQIG